MLLAELWQEIVGRADLCIYPAGAQLLSQGSSKSDVYLIRRGLIKLQSTNSEGRETIVAVKRTGSLVGVDAAVLRQPSLVSAVTVTECCLHRFPAPELRKVVCKHATFSCLLHGILASELREVTAALTEIKFHSAEIRLKWLLLELVPELTRPGAQNDEVRLPFKQWEIAQMLGVTPEHLSRLLRRLANEEFMERRRVTFVGFEAVGPKAAAFATRTGFADVQDGRNR
jgi:CRP-like cAMP-binding protein